MSFRASRRSLRSYHELRTQATDTPEIQRIRQNDLTINDVIDTDLILEVHGGRVDLLLTEDRAIHEKARVLGICDRVLSIEMFLERAMREHPELVDYRVLSVRKEYFGNVDVSAAFFDSFRTDYPGFVAWFNRKADEVAYVCRGEDGSILAYLYVKLEGIDEVYADIAPLFAPRRRLKIGTFKVAHYGFKLGERLIKIVFDNALRLGVDEIYVTAFLRTVETQALVAMLEGWGFTRWGIKNSGYGDESVWLRRYTPAASMTGPASTYPYMSSAARKFIVPIYPQYHTELFPDSILNTESPMAFVENRPNRNAIRKAYISRSHYRDLRSGDIVVFYRTGDGSAPAHYTAVATTLGIVEAVHDSITDYDSFRRACMGVSVFTDEELRQHWDYDRRNRPFVLRFLCTFSLPRRPNLLTMKEAGVLEEHPRGFELLTDIGFRRLLEISDARHCPVVN